MRLTVFGATGKIGRLTVEQLLAQGSSRMSVIGTS